MPIGVVGVITPWNFPIAIPSWKIAPALVCGNTVVFKPATDTPLLGERFVELLAEAGVPAGVVNVVHGGGERRRRPARAPPRRAGDHVHRLARDRRRGDAGRGRHLKHVHLELGGKNAIIVLDDADLDLAVEGIVWSAFGTSGQRCTAASRVIVQQRRLRRAPVAARRRAEKLRLGPGWEDEHRRRPRDQPARAREDPLVHRDRRRRGREAAHRRRGRGGQRPRRRLLLPADDLRRRRARDAHRAGGDLRPDDRADPRRRLRRGDPRRERRSSTASRRRSSRAT